MQITCLMFGGN